MALVVQKYGGSSLATPKLILRVASRIEKLKKSGVDVVVVASAMGNTTDHLLRLARKTVSHPSERELDMLLTAGERISMSLLAMALQDLNVSAISFTGSQSGIITTGDHTHARILEIRPHRIREELARGKVVIIAGFQGVSHDREITTLGRGGSDTSAVALAAALNADRCEILTDVEGLYTADPKRVPNAQMISEITYDEATEMANLGAKMHVRSIEVAKQYGVKVRIASSANETTFGTQLVGQGENVEQRQIRAIVTREGFVGFWITGNLSDVIGGLEECGVSIRFVTHVKESIAVLCDRDQAVRVRRFLGEGKWEFTEVSAVGTVSAVGEGISLAAEWIPKFISLIGRVAGSPLLLASNSASITAAVSADVLTRTAQALHFELVEQKEKREIPLQEREKGDPLTGISQIFGGDV